MAKKYVPPRQRGLGQFIDSLFILVLVYVSLYVPLWMESGAAPETAATPHTAAAASAPPATWEALGVSPVAQEQWTRLGYDAAQAALLLETRFDYTIDPLMLLITAAVIVGYFIYLLKASDRQYREVIAERFGDDGGDRDKSV